MYQSDNEKSVRLEEEKIYIFLYIYEVPVHLVHLCRACSNPLFLSFFFTQFSNANLCFNLCHLCRTVHNPLNQASKF